VLQLDAHRLAYGTGMVDIAAIPQDDLDGRVRRAHPRHDAGVARVGPDEDPDPRIPFRVHRHAGSAARRDVPDVDGTPAAADHEVAAVAAEPRHLGRRAPTPAGTHPRPRPPRTHPR